MLGSDVHAAICEYSPARKHIFDPLGRLVYSNFENTTLDNATSIKDRTGLRETAAEKKTLRRKATYDASVCGS